MRNTFHASCLNFVFMQHRGEIVKKAVEESGYKKTELARHLKVERRSLYNFFERADLSLDTILNIGKIIHHDFSNEIKELKKTSNHNISDKSVPGYRNDEAEFWKDKYLTLLEEYNSLLKEVKGK